MVATGFFYVRRQTDAARNRPSLGEPAAAAMSAPWPVVVSQEALQSHNHSNQETAMSKGQRGNKELKKPKKALPPPSPAGPASLVPAGIKSPDPIKRK